MTGVLVAISKGIFNLLYKIFNLLPRRDEVLFFSRQANEPSYDFKMLGREFNQQGYSVVYLTKKLSARTFIPYVGHVLKEIYHLARCRVCFLDRYDPVICMLNFKCEPTAKSSADLHWEFPVEPIVIQLWHAFGAFKKFGYQSLDTREGHSSKVAHRFDIHRNYSWIICTGESSRQPFAEAFAYPVERIVALGRPEYDLLVNERQQIDSCMRKRDCTVILFAPTLRKSSASRHPFRDLYEKRDVLFSGIDADIVWSFHPLEETGIASGDVNDLLRQCDYIVTDYSSIAYEAFLLGKRVLFYVPDINDYRNSPGLNSDPLNLAPSISICTEQNLIDTIAALVQDGNEQYDYAALDAFIGDTFRGLSQNRPLALATFVLNRIER